MPWNCLCSSGKEKYKPEISAPILNRDDKRIAKIIPNPTKDEHQQLQIINPPFQRNVNQQEIGLNNNYPDDGKQRIKSSSAKQKQRSKKHAKNAKDSHALFQPGGNGGESQSSSPQRAATNVKFSIDAIDRNSNATPPLVVHHTEPDDEDTTYSQLIFNRNVNKSNEPLSANIVSSNTAQHSAPAKSATPTTTPSSHLARRDDPNIGHYDRLPFDKSLPQNVSENINFQHQHSSGANHANVYADHQRTVTQSHGQATYYEAGHHQRMSTRTATGGVDVSSVDAIPFIDEEDIVSIIEKHGTHLRIHENNDNNNNNNNNPYSSATRIITLHPKNVGSSQTIQSANTLQRAQLLNAITTKSDPSSHQRQAPRADASVIGVVDSNGNVTDDSVAVATMSRQAVGRGINGGGGDDMHEFFSWNPAKGKLCQICHASALNGSSTVVKCRSCDLVCHVWCVPRIVPSVRYHDTSFIIHRKWLRSEDELAFPTVHKYVVTSNIQSEDNLTKPDCYLTDSECTYSNQTDKRIDQDAASRNKRKSRRRTRSLEKRNPTATTTSTNADDNVTERFIIPNLNRSKNNEQLSLRANENKNTIRVEANADPIPKGHQLRIDESEQNASTRAADAESSRAAGERVVGETSDESDDEFGSKGSCYDAANGTDGGLQSTGQRLEGDLISVDVHPEPQLRPESRSRPPSASGGGQRSSGLKITEPCDVKETKEIVPAISDKDKLRKGLVERQMSYTSDESASEPYPSRGLLSSRMGERTSSLRGSVRSATSVCSSSVISASASDRVSDDVEDATSLDSSSTLQVIKKMIRVNSQSFSLSSTLNKKSNEDRVDSSQQILPKLETQNWAIQTSAQSTTSQQPTGASPSSNLRLHYVTERILAYILPTQNGNHLGANDQYEKEVIPMLEQKHGKNYQLFNLEKCISVITLERICELCKHIDKWLGSGQEKVVVLQDSEDCQRLGATIIAFLEYLRICASTYQTRNINMNDDARAQNTITRNWMNLDMFSMKKFLEGNIEPLRIPSYKRYIRYFSGLLSGQIKLNSSPLHLNYISIESPPSWLQYNGVSSKSEWSSFIKIYEGLQCVYTSDIHIIPITTRKFLYQIGDLRLRGDILVRCYQISAPDGNYAREFRKLLFSVQFHTCAIKTDEVAFGKEDLDYAHADPRFPNDCKVTFHLNSGANNFLFQSPLIRTERANDIAKANSIEHLDLNSCHTQGPLDGSLYATILKSPKSSHYSTQSVRTVTIPSSTTNQYGFDKSFDSIVDYKPIDSSTPIKSSSQTEIISGRNSFREASVPLTRSDYATYHTDSRPGTSQSQSIYRHQHSGHPTPSTSHHHQTSTSSSSTVTQTIQNPDNRINHNGTREFVRSPLTLSVDSGISSSGILNRPTLASSVSPSSLPSQVSPQEDRHRELDDILSDMLLTVQDIPDFQNRKPSTHSINQYSRSQSVLSHASAPASSPIYTLPIPNPPAHNTNRDIVHTTHSYVSQDNIQRHSNTNSYKPDRFDPYDTASTTTTLTPPPSESGRDTPNLFAGYHSSTSNMSLAHSRQQPRRDATGTMSSQHSQMNSQSPHTNPQHQSTIYQRVVRTSNESHPIVVSASEDEDNIPYHAREHSQPFTYGNLPSNGVHLNEVSGSDNNQPKDPRMIKAQSGLTSPMLVRKTFGGGNASGATSDSAAYSILRKTPTRNDFEEMLRERREKVMSEKYSISDKPPVTSNGYHSFYPDSFKRSNTMDGFHRSNSNAELSGQTWLQLQKQKLRAKKNQQQRDDRKYFEEIHTEIKNRSLRPRSNVRYDGYASDTAAFDEVDFRRPLQVQPPYHTANSSPERHYHTISSTTKTVTKERPFVSVKRSHETAKQDKLGSPSLSPLAILNASPLGHIAQAQQNNNIRNSNSNINSNSNNQNGLLSLADSPISNGRARLESDKSKTNVHTDNLTSAKACANSHNNNLNTDVSPLNSNNNNNSNHVIADNNNLNEIHLKITDNTTIIDYNSTDLPNNTHNNNICYTPTHNNMPYNANAETIENHTNSTNQQNTSTNGQIALEELLANLAVEKDLMDQHLIQNKQVTTNGSDTTYEQKANQELSDVIADLAEFTRYESQRLANGFGDSLSNNSSDSSNGSNVNNAQKRLLSESDQSSSISPSPSDRSNNLALWHEQVREESFSSYRSETDQDISIAGSPRPETPAFPVTPRTPYGMNGSVSPGIPPRSPTPQRVSFEKSNKELYGGAQKGIFQEVSNQNDTIYRNRANSTTSNTNSEPQEVAQHLVKFVRDSSKFWYKPNLSREEAIDLLRNATPGTFVVRNSTTFKNAYGLVVRVAQPPPGVTASPGSGELVRHFLVEPTTRGVRLKGCANEPVFTSLSALVYQHTITPLALPCRLIIPENDIQAVNMHTPAQKQLLTQGAATNVLYLYSCGTESLTGDEAVRRAVSQLFSIIPLPKPTEVHFKVAQQGITLTDNTRQKFFRKHYTAHNISFCGIDPEHRQWSVKTDDGNIPVSNKTIFAFVARRSPSSKDNQCHVFCELNPAQPANAIISFANKVLPTEKQINRNI